MQASKRQAAWLAQDVIPDEEMASQRNDLELAAIFASDDMREGTLAFTQKRPPVWRAR